MKLKEFSYEYNPEYPETLNKFLDYLCTVKERSENTIIKYADNMEHFLKYIRIKKGLTKYTNYEQVSIRRFSDTEIRKISLSDIESYLKVLKDDYKNSPATRSNKISTLDTFYKFLMKQHIVDRNLIDGVERPKLKKKEISYLTLEESKKILDSIKNSNREFVERDYCLFTLYLNLGTRLEELVNVDLEDLDIENRKLLVLGKGNKERLLSLNNACIKVLNDYLKVREDLVNRDIVKKKNKSALFISKKGNRLSKDQVQNSLKDYAELAGLDVEKVHVHTLRHTAATLMYKYGGVDIRKLQKVLGHNSITTTQIYTHVDDAQVQEAINANPLADL